MIITQIIQNILISSPSITSQVPATSISGPQRLKQGQGFPYIRHFPVGWQTPLKTHEGMARLQTCDAYQVSIYTGTYTSAENIAKAVITALNGVHGDAGGTSIVWNGALRPLLAEDEDTKAEGVMVEFRVSIDFFA